MRRATPRGLQRLCALALCAAALAGCRSAPEPRAAFGNDRGPGAAAPVAVIRGKPVSKAALHDFWFARYPDAYARTLDAYVDERIVIQEVHRHGVRVPRAALAKALDAEVAAREKQLQSLYGEEASLDAELRQAYGVDRATWRRTILGPRMHTRLLMERVIRWDGKRRDQVHARVIVLRDEAQARRVIAKLRAGADFSLTAASASIDPSGKRGGELPPFGRGDLAYPDVEARLLAAAERALVGPLEVRVDDATQWHVYKVIRRAAAWPGSLEAHWQRLEDDLRARKVSQGEYRRWQARVRRAAGVRFYRPDGRVREPAPPR